MKLNKLKAKHEPSEGTATVTNINILIKSFKIGVFISNQ